MYHCFAITSFMSEFSEISVHQNVQMTENQVRKPEIHAEKRHRYGHHDRRGPHIQARRPIDLPHLHAHVVQETSDVLPIEADLPHRLHQRKSAYSLVVRHFAARPHPLIPAALPTVS